MPPWVPDGSSTIQAMSAWPEYMWGVQSFDFDTNSITYGPEDIYEGALSRPICLAPTSEGHGVRGFICSVIWPPGTTEGEVEVQGADLNQDAAYHILGTITFPAVQYSSPAGLVVNFMRTLVNVATNSGTLTARLTIR